MAQIYKKNGGQFENIDISKIVEHYSFRLNVLSESYSEGIIPDFVWKFVKGIMKNPLKAGILALIISNYMGKNETKESITIPVEVGDTILGGKFKNKKIIVKDIGKNDKGEVTINGKPLMRFRLTSQEESYQERLSLMVIKLKEISKTNLQDINLIRDNKKELTSLKQVTDFIKKYNLAKEGLCQNLASLYYKANKEKGEGISTIGHVAYLFEGMVYDPIRFNTLPVSLKVWKEKFKKNKIVKLII